MGTTSENIKIKFQVDGKDVSVQVNGVNDSLDKMNKKAENVSSAFKKVAITALGFVSIKAGMDKAIKSAVSLEAITKKLNVATGNAAKSFADVTKIASKYGLEIQGTADAYGAFAVATKGTMLEGEQALTVFDNVSAAIAGMGLSGDSSTRIFRALEQMMSKGKVSAEELRGQLGDAGLAGAFGIAAKSMGKTTAEFDKLLSTGKIMSADFIPGFARQLKEDLGNNSINVANTMQGALSSLDNTVFLTSSAIGKELTTVVVSFAKSMKEMQPQVTSSIKSIKEFASFANDMTTVVGGATNAIGLATVGFIAYSNKAAIATAATVTFSAVLKSIAVIRFAAATGSLLALTSAAAVAAAPFVLLASAIGTVVYQLKQEKEALKAIESADNVNVDINKQKLAMYKRLKSALIENGVASKDLSKKVKELGINSAKLFTDDKQIRKVSHALAQLKSEGFAKNIEKVKLFKEELKSAGIDLDEISKKRDFKGLDDAISKTEILKKKLLSTVNSLSTKYAKSLKTKAQVDLDNFNKIVKEAKAKGLENTAEFKQLEENHTAFLKKEADKRVEAEAKASAKRIEISRKEAEKFISNFKNAKSSIESSTISLGISNKKKALSNSKKSSKKDNSTVTGIEAQISQINSLFDQKNKIAAEQFAIEKSNRDAAFKEEINALGLKEKGKEELLAQFRQTHLDNEAAFEEEKRLADEERFANKLALLEERNAAENELKMQFRQEGANLFQQFGDLQNNITSANFNNLIKQTKSFQTNTLKLWQKGEQGKLLVTQSVLGGLSGLMDSHNRKAFEAGKVAAIANATISTIQGATQALSLGPILGPIMAGVVSAMGFANIAKIASTPFKGGGGGGKPQTTSPSIPAVATPIPAQQSQSSQTNNQANVNLTLQALDPASIDETTIQKIGDKLAPVLQNSFNGNQNFSIT